MKRNMLKGVKVGRLEVELGILQFAYDTLLMCEDNVQNVLTIKAILRCYELASGLKINFHKSNLAVINIEKTSFDCYARILNYSQMTLPFKYLGMVIGGNPRKGQFWEHVVNKIRIKLSSWKGKLLSLAGRVCLIKSVLSAIPLFYFSVFKAPESVYKKLISIQRRFLWGWGRDKRTIPWISWENICKTREEGGLGIKDIRCFNYALLAKWKWRIHGEERGKWKEIIESKYGSGTDQSPIPIKYQSWWWRDLIKVCGEESSMGWFHKEIKWKIGVGDKIRFWEDSWVNNNSLKSIYPRLYALSVDQGLKVKEVGSWVDSVWIWNLRWRRPGFEWEVALQEELSRTLAGFKLDREMKDCMTWKGEDFSVKSAYECVTKSDSCNKSIIFEHLWMSRAFPNVQITAWRVLLDRLPTRINLSRRGVGVNTSLCALCQKWPESAQHLFLECEFAIQVWNWCFRWIGIMSVQQKILKDHFESFYLMQMSYKQNFVWKGVWTAIVWSIWDQRNRTIFKQDSVDTEEIFHMAQLKTWLWLRYRMKSFNYSFSDWLLNPILCIKSC